MVSSVKNKGKGATGKRKERRGTKFKAPAKHNNILRDEGEERAKKKERRQEANTGFGLGSLKPPRKFKEKAFVRPAKPAVPVDRSEIIPEVALSRKELKQATEAWKLKRKPNFATVQVRRLERTRVRKPPGCVMAPRRVTLSPQVARLSILCSPNTTAAPHGVVGEAAPARH